MAHQSALKEQILQPRAQSQLAPIRLVLTLARSTQASSCRRRRHAVPAQRTRRLWSMVPADKAAEAGGDKAPQIDITQFGYFKVLGKGVLPPKPIVVKAKLISKVAGGAVVLTA